ncbi:DUF1707 domain-containing protein [Streptomyces sp. NPDC044571]|uniref:DUF1707 SHOCT-like domain-containing protein n=1 Tax=Streptomyces sp. NPDC044571 TaxID=3155371 RepID=UPI0033EE5729
MDLEKHPAASAPAVPAEPAAVRASDADRDRIARILADALAEGRLTADEHAERLDSLYAVKTVGKLEVLVRDLPAPGGAAPAVPSYAHAHALAGSAGTAGTAETVLAVCSSASRKGRWRPGPHTRAVSVMGDIGIDLTEAVFAQQVTEIQVTCILGNVEVLVPENVTLRGYGGGVLGNFEVRGEGGAATDPNAPVVIVRGFSLLGNIEARRKPGARLVDLARTERDRLDGR